MTQILASGKSGSDKYDIFNKSTGEGDIEKVFTRLDARSLAEDLQFFYNVTQGYCQSGDEGKETAKNPALSVINASNLSSFSHKYTQALNTLIGFANFLDTDSATTANSIVLKAIKITNEISPDGTNHSQENPLPFAFKDNLTFRFKAKYTNTGAVQIQINNLNGLTGAISLLKESGEQLSAGDIMENKYYTIIANSVVVGGVTTNRFLLKNEVRQASSASLGLTYLNQPITIANNTTDANNDIDFTAGNFQFDDKSGEAFASAMTKRLDASWTAGNNQGGLDTGTKQASTWYHCYAIYNPTTQASDFLFSASATSPTLPTGFTKYKYLGSVLTNVSGNIIAFRQTGNYFEWKDAFLDQTGALAGTKIHPISVPPVIVLANISMTGSSGSGETHADVGIFGNNATPNSTVDFIVAFLSGQWEGPGSATKLVLSTNQTIKSKTSYSAGSGSVYKLSTFGYFNLSL